MNLFDTINPSKLTDEIKALGQDTKEYCPRCAEELRPGEMFCCSACSFLFYQEDREDEGIGEQGED